MAFAFIAVAVFSEAALTAVILAEAVSYAGIAWTVAGAVTGNKDMMKLGSALSIVGGVGSLVNAGIGTLGDAALSEAAKNEAATSLAEFGGKDIAENLGTNSIDNAIANSAATGAVTSSVLPQGEVVRSALGDTVGNAADALTTPTPTTPYGMSSSNALTDQGAQEALSGVGQDGLSPNYANAPSSPNAPTVTDATNNASNVVNNVQDTGNQFAIDDARQKAMEATDGYGIQSSANVGTGATDPTTYNAIKTAFGQGWEGLGKTGQDMVLKSVLAIPGGIQQQKNAAAQLAMNQRNLDINQQRVNQTSYGSQIPTWNNSGILSSAKKGG